MKQFLLSFLAFFLISTSIRAQITEFAPIGAYWNYTWASPGGGGGLLTKVVGDTVVNGKTFKKLYNDEFTYYPFPPNYGAHRYSTGYLSIRNDSVFGGLGQDYFNFSFRMQINDTIQFRTFSNFSTYGIADSIGRIDLGGSNRRVVFISKYCKNNATGSIKKTFGRSRIVDTIGLLEGIWSEPDCGLLDLNAYFLNCYKAGTFQFPINTYCPSTVATNELMTNQISIFPNPANTDLTINFPSEMRLNSVELMNYLGQKIKVEKGDNLQKINVSNLPNGAYVIRLVFDNQSITKKIVIQH